MEVWDKDEQGEEYYPELEQARQYFLVMYHALSKEMWENLVSVNLKAFDPSMDVNSKDIKKLRTSVKSLEGLVGRNIYLADKFYEVGVMKDAVIKYKNAFIHKNYERMEEYRNVMNSNYAKFFSPEIPKADNKEEVHELVEDER